MPTNDTNRQEGTGLIGRLVRRLTDPSADRYSPVVQMRTFGRGSTESRGGSTRDARDDEEPHEVVSERLTPRNAA